MFKKLKHFIWHRQQTETYCKTYCCGIRIRKKKELRPYYDRKFSELGNIIRHNQTAIIQQISELSAEIQTQFYTIQNKYTELCRHFDINSNDLLLKSSELLTKTDWYQQQTKQYFNELNFADLLHDTTIQSPWLRDKSFSLFGWAANYSFIYTLCRILDKVRPTDILEMGLGQTTRLTSQYIAYNRNDAHLTVCEHNADWIDIYKKDLPNTDNIDLHHFNLEYFEYEGQQNDKYAGLLEYIGKQKFDLIIVDGPVGGGKNLPRSNILDLIRNNNLADDFIIIFDDAERNGEKTTISFTHNLLTEKAVNFMTYERSGLKRQHIITSISRDFTRYL